MFTEYLIVLSLALQKVEASAENAMLYWYFQTDFLH